MFILEMQLINELICDGQLWLVVWKLTDSGVSQQLNRISIELSFDWNDQIDFQLSNDMSQLNALKIQLITMDRWNVINFERKCDFNQVPMRRKGASSEPLEYGQEGNINTHKYE